MKESDIIIYCDGACLGNPGPGGYAALLMIKSKPETEKVVCGHEPSTTNNRMELRAAIEGLKALKRACAVVIYSDSQYVIKGMTEWRFGWQRSGFKNAKKQPVINADLWKDLISVAEAHNITWKWVKGHAGNEHNERVDEIAREQAGLALHQSQFGHS